MTILNEVLSGVGFGVNLNESGKEQLYQELYYFGLLFGLNVCEALGHA